MTDFGGVVGVGAALGETPVFGEFRVRQVQGRIWSSPFESNLRVDTGLQQGDLMEAIEPVQPPSVPAEYCGRWIAWNHDRTRIVASGTTLIEAREAARQAGETRPFLTKAPEAHVRFVGGRR